MTRDDIDRAWRLMEAQGPPDPADLAEARAAARGMLHCLVESGIYPQILPLTDRDC